MNEIIIIHMNIIHFIINNRHIIFQHFIDIISLYSYIKIFYITVWWTTQFIPFLSTVSLAYAAKETPWILFY